MPWFDYRDVRSLTKSLEELTAVAKGIRHVLTMPGPLKIVFTGEAFEGEEAMLKQLITFDIVPEPLGTRHDVVSRDLKVYSDDVLIDERTLGPNEVLVTGFKAVQDSACRAELRDLDDGGLYSLTRVKEFVALDTVPPPMPGDMGVVITGEVFEEEPEEIEPLPDVPTEEPVPDVPAEPTPVEEPTGEVPAEETPVEEPPAEGEEPTV